MRYRITFLVFLLMVAATGCASVRVSHDYDREVDFSGLRTYGWMKKPESPGDRVQASVEKSSLLEKRIKDAVNLELEAKGLKEDPIDPDFLVAYRTSARETVRSSQTYWSGTRFQEYQEGSLVLDFVNPENGELLWRGVARETIDPHVSPKRMEKTIRDAVKTVLKKFPP
jgi:hypothetical protein